MLINDVENRDSLVEFVVAELREDYGIKYHKESKNRKLPNGKQVRCKIFNVPLHLLPLTDAFLSSGTVVQVPHFISDACQKILNSVETEGLFRKAGSSVRQREIRASLEGGKPLTKGQNVIDIANVLKSFFRDLPDPILPPGNCQETMLRCLLLNNEARRLNALLLTCLLLPPLSLNTFAFFMQFLFAVSQHSNLNKMTIQNLAIILTPSLMPLEDFHSSVRLNNHVKVIEMLIENSREIGIVPESFLERIPEPCSSSSSSLLDKETYKKTKKRRSSSLTRAVINVVKKKFGRQSTDAQLDDTPKDHISVTPCISKSNKKRKNIEIIPAAEMMGFSAKKKKSVLSFMPQAGEILPSTPMIFKEAKKSSRLSLMSRLTKSKEVVPAQDASITSSISSPLPPVMERRWSFVGTPVKNLKSSAEMNEGKFLSPVVSLPCLTLKDSLDTLEGLKIPEMEKDYVRIPKREYEEIKDRVKAIERRISREFDQIEEHQKRQSLTLNNEKNDVEMVTSVEAVQGEYKKTLEETENLARRLSRDLKIRRSVEHKIIRSPSARKIGSIRRRSRDKVNRTKSWHVASTSGKDKTEENSVKDTLTTFYPKQGSNLKRGKPVQVGSRAQKSPLVSNFNNLAEFYPKREENWTDAKDFFTEIPPLIAQTPTREPVAAISERRSSLRSAQTTPTSVQKQPDSNFTKTPMLPPKKMAPKTPKTDAKRTPHLPLKTHLTPLQDQQTGRASIARIRSQNAGMVMAKAKLFDGLVVSHDFVENCSKVLNGGAVLKKENLHHPNFRKPLLAISPRKIVKTPSRDRNVPLRVTRATSKSPGQYARPLKLSPRHL